MNFFDIDIDTFCNALGERLGDEYQIDFGDDSIYENGYTRSIYIYKSEIDFYEVLLFDYNKEKKLGDIFISFSEEDFQYDEFLKIVSEVIILIDPSLSEADIINAIKNEAKRVKEEENMTFFDKTFGNIQFSQLDERAATIKKAEN